MNDMIRVEGLVAGYEQPVVGPVTFSVAAGAVIGLAGPNGAGKTTLFRALMGEARIFRGRVLRAAGVRLAHQRQRPTRLPEMPITGAELLAGAGVAVDSMPACLEPVADRRLDRLSGGQLQLLQTWACLAHRRHVTLLDEPTNNLDPDAVSTLAELLLREPADRGVVIISHERPFLEHVCTCVIDVGMSNPPYEAAP